MKILFVLEYHHPHIGGVESLFKALTEKLVTQGHEVIVLTNKYLPSLATDEVLNGVRILRYNFRSRYLFTFLAWLPVLRWSKEIDLIHTTSYNAAIPAWIAARLRRKKVIITFHEYWGNLWFELPWMSRPVSVLHAIFEKVLVKLTFDRFIGVSDYTKQRLINVAQVDSKHVTRIYNGIDYINEDWPIHHAANPSYTFTYFGRIGYSKGVNLILEAVHLLKKENFTSFRVQLVVPKEGLINKVKSLLAAYDISANIILYHELQFTQLKGLIAASDAVIIPSYSEGFCFAAVETMAIGTPIISSGRGALSEVVGGDMIEFEDQSGESLAVAMKKAISNEWIYKSKRQYPLSDTINAYIAEYESLLNSTS